MSVHVQLTRERTNQALIRVDHESRTLAGQRTEALDSELLRDLPVGIGEQRKVEAVLLVEGFLPIHRIGADPYALGTERCELARQIAKVTAFLRSARRHRFRVKEQDDRPAIEQAT